MLPGRLAVPRVEAGDRLELRWTESKARAFQLLDVLLHELEHHHDRVTTASRDDAARGEPYAGAYALRVLDELWIPYLDAFGL